MRKHHFQKLLNKLLHNGVSKHPEIHRNRPEPPCDAYQSGWADSPPGASGKDSTTPGFCGYHPEADARAGALQHPTIGLEIESPRAESLLLRLDNPGEPLDKRRSLALREAEAEYTEAGVETPP